jgi:hypothetical protein
VVLPGEVWADRELRGQLVRLGPPGAARHRDGGQGDGRDTHRDAVIAALRGSEFQGIAYARPVTWDAKGDNTAAVILLNVVEGDHFKEIGEVSRDELVR